MWMLRPRVDVEMAHDLPAEPIVRYHPLHGALNDAIRVLLSHRGQGHFPQTARVLRVAVIDLVLFFLARHAHLFGVDDDDVIPHGHVRRIGRLVLAAKNRRDARRQTAKGLALGVNDAPSALNLALLGAIGSYVCHRRLPQSFKIPSSYSTSIRQRPAADIVHVASPGAPSRAN